MSIGTTDDTADRVQGLMDELRKPEVACLTNASVNALLTMKSDSAFSKRNLNLTTNLAKNSS